MTWLRLRQIALVARDLDTVLGRPARRVRTSRSASAIPHIGTLGLHNVVIPVGGQFLEVVSPIARARRPSATSSAAAATAATW